MSFYKLEDFVHDQGINMGEFRRFDKETQDLWRKVHQKKIKEKLNEREETTFRDYFLLILKNVEPDDFDNYEPQKQEELREEYKEWKKEEQKMRAAQNRKWKGLE